MVLAGMQASMVRPMPMTPAVKPTMMVSALNTRLMSLAGADGAQDADLLLAFQHRKCR